MRGTVWFVFIALSIITARASADDHFDQKIAPLLARRCLDCHAGAEPQGKLDLSQKATAMAGGESGVAITPGKLDDSLLWQRIVDGDMPPKKPLPEAERALLKAWIEDGARWGEERIDPFRFTTDARAGRDWWALQPVVRPDVPQLNDDALRHNAIDAFVQHKLKASELPPNPPAKPGELLRRLSLDLLGLPPTPAEVEAFVADKSPDATVRSIERLLASPNYGERWAHHWLDVARFGESQGFERDKLRTDSWRYRDWVVQALNDDLPYDQFVRLQVAGDVLQPQSADAIAATGFLVAGPWDEVGKAQQSAAMKAVVRQDELEDYVSVVGQTFLGLTVNCARCHDHKFDPIYQREYYQLTAALAGVEHGSRPLPENAKDRFQNEITALQARSELISAKIAKREQEVREELAKERRERVRLLEPPTPFAEWRFEKDLRDTQAVITLREKGNAAVKEGQLELDGKEAHVLSEPVKTELGAKTLVAWVKLANLSQRGGAVIGVQSLDGSVFDAIVFGEQEPGKWMAGSNFFARTKPFAADAEQDADKNTVCIAIVYAEDGTITAYRNGAPYGKPYTSSGLNRFKAGEWQVSFGVRHTPPGSGKMLAGSVDRAMLFNRAISAEEMAVLAGAADAPIAEAEIIARLSPEDREWRAAVKQELTQINEQIARFEQAVTYAVSPKTPHVVHVLARGEPNKPEAEVAAGGVSSLGATLADFGLEKAATDAERRQKLADWLASPNNPLTARVMVNRLWHYHFGVGIVETPNDFGFNGGRPTHPELLDWLAAELIDSGWSIKHIQRLILNSATFQQSSLVGAEGLAKDADNRLLWRKSPQRLDAETLRDAILAVSGELNTDMGGPGFADFTTFVANSQFYEIIDNPGPTFHRRSLYRMWIRSARSPLLDVFDCPDPSTKTPARAVTTTPLQALSLLNNSFALRMSERTALRLQNECGDDLSAQIERLYRLSFGRSAHEKEVQLAKTFAKEHGVSALVRILLNSNEFIYVD